jgi:two-component sensor histidine kinase
MGSMSAIGSSLPDAMLIVSELVTNTVRRSQGDGRGVIAVSVRRFRNHLVIRVSHPGSGEPGSRPSPIPATPVNGFGQRIVERLASRWGTEGPDGVVAWAELPLTARG